MNTEIEPVHIGQEDDIEIGSVENFEHEEIDYAIFRLESGFFATQGHCVCEDQAFLSESNVEGEELEWLEEAFALELVRDKETWQEDKKTKKKLRKKALESKIKRLS